MDEFNGQNYIINNYPELKNLWNDPRRKRRQARLSHRVLNKSKSIRKYREARLNQKRKNFEIRFFKLLSNGLEFFNCLICGNAFDSPVSVSCGYTFCMKCVNSVDCCPYCKNSHFGKYYVNVRLQDLLDKWKDHKAASCWTDYLIAAVGMEPRYCLRSRYAGLQIKNNNYENNRRPDAPAEKPQPGAAFPARFRKSRKKKATLQKDLDVCLQSIFEEVESIQARSLKMYWKYEDGDFECVLCGQCLMDPVTTTCGHSFCKNCLVRALDYRLHCPLCMTSLTFEDYYREKTLHLDQAVQFLFPAEYRERTLTRLKEIEIFDNEFELPVFLCTNAFPTVACPLYVFEPQYRLLTRRCLQSSEKKFAMVAKSEKGKKPVTYGTLLELRDAIPLKDGCFIITSIGIRRFKIMSMGKQDGYCTARVSYIKDSAISIEQSVVLDDFHRKVHAKAARWLESLTPSVLSEVERLIGSMPEIEENWFTLPDGPAWTWWLMPIMPITSQLHMIFLSTTSFEKRLRAIDKMLDHMKIRMQLLDRTVNNVKTIETIDDICDDYN